MQQYRAAIGCFVSFHASLCKSHEHVLSQRKNIIRVCRGSVNFIILLVLLTSICKLLLLGGDIEINPGPPTRKCPQCSAMIHLRKHKCDCGHLLGNKRGRQVLEKRQCPQCASLVVINKPRCNCGFSIKKIDACSKAATQRKQRNQKHMADIRAIEPVEVAARRKQQNREQWLMQEPLKPHRIISLRMQLA